MAKLDKVMVGGVAARLEALAALSRKAERHLRSSPDCNVPGRRLGGRERHAGVQEGGGQDEEGAEPAVRKIRRE